MISTCAVVWDSSEIFRKKKVQTKALAIQPWRGPQMEKPQERGRQKLERNVPLKNRGEEKSVLLLQNVNFDVVTGSNT